MFEKILIANRGEIALRILRACRELGLRAVVAYSEADSDSLPVRLADEAVCIGPAHASKSYLNIPNIVSAALITGCDALHPGYGFLAENPYLAEICEKYNLTFIGPPPAAIEQMGDKALARRIMQKAGLPVLPGTDRPLRSLNEARAVADDIGYPVMLKAAAGGGGRGLRVARNDAELVRLFPIAEAEAQSAFGDGSLYLEKYLEQCRHVEVQVLGDGAGNVIHLGERDCSIQRRHQKLIEESLSPALSPSLRQAMGEAAVQGAKAIGYANAGTLEFLVDRHGHFYFMEMNTRIQVEHPVTEMVTGIDLVKWQIRIAAGEPLTLPQEGVRIIGHALECRINAEDPARGFQPDSGVVQTWVIPGGPGVRVDSHLYPGYAIPPFYDSLLAKVITWGADREEARQRMERALGELIVEGVSTTVPFHLQLLRHPAFQRGEACCDFVERHFV